MAFAGGRSLAMRAADRHTRKQAASRPQEGLASLARSNVMGIFGAGSERDGLQLLLRLESGDEPCNHGPTCDGPFLGRSP